MKLTPEIAQALTNLRGNGDFKVFLEGAKEYESNEKQNCVDREGPNLFRSQGAVKALQSLLSAFDNAPNALEKFKTKQGK